MDAACNFINRMSKYCCEALNYKEFNITINNDKGKYIQQQQQLYLLFFIDLY